VGADVSVHFDAVGKRLGMTRTFELVGGETVGGAMAENLGAINDAA